MESKKRFTVIEALLLVVIVSIISFISGYALNSNTKPVNKVSQNPTTQKQSENESTDPTSGWKSYTSAEGKYSLKYPNSWVTATNPDLCSPGIFLVGPSADSVGTCGSDNIGQIAFSSFTVESGPIGLSEEYYSDIKVEPATADSVKGERHSGVYSYEGEGIGPPKGTKEVVYIFKTNGTIYKATYIQTAGYPEVEKEFNLIVTKTLRFTR